MAAHIFRLILSNTLSIIVAVATLCCRSARQNRAVSNVLNDVGQDDPEPYRFGAIRQAPRRSGRYGSPYVAVSLANPLSPPPKESEHAIASVLGSRGRRKNSEGSMYSGLCFCPPPEAAWLGLAWLALLLRCVCLAENSADLFLSTRNAGRPNTRERLLPQGSRLQDRGVPG